MKNNDTIYENESISEHSISSPTIKVLKGIVSLFKLYLKQIKLMRKRKVKNMMNLYQVMMIWTIRLSLWIQGQELRVFHQLLNKFNRSPSSDLRLKIGICSFWAYSKSIIRLDIQKDLDNLRVQTPKNIKLDGERLPNLNDTPNNEIKMPPTRSKTRGSAIFKIKTATNKEKSAFHRKSVTNVFKDRK